MHVARDLMRRRVISVSPETPVETAIDLLVENELSGLPVVDSDGHVLGIFSEIDRFQCGNADGRSVKHLMTTNALTVDVRESLVEVAHLFREHSVRRLPVTDKGKMVGIIGLRDLVRFIRETERTLEGMAPVLHDWELFESECWSNVD